MSKKDDPRQDDSTSNCPDGVSLGRRQLGRRRCQGAYMDGVSRWKGIEPLSRQRFPCTWPNGEAVRALLIEDFS
jgi:hypothetical protein